MNRTGHKMLSNENGAAGSQRDMGLPYLDRLADLAASEPDNRLAVEAARLRALQAAAAVPSECGPDIAASVARGGFVLHQNIEMLAIGSTDVEAVHRGYGGRSAIRRGDVFDRMFAAAKRAKRPAPLMPSQVAIGRRYHDLVEMLSADGVKLSQLQASFGGGGKRDWMDRRMEFSEEVDRMRRRLLVGPVHVLRRVRPSQRNRDLAPGEAAPQMFTRRDLIDAVCLRDMPIPAALRLFGWQSNGRNGKAALEALAGALDAMIGYWPRKSS